MDTLRLTLHKCTCILRLLTDHTINIYLYNVIYVCVMYIQYVCMYFMLRVLVSIY